MRRLRLSIAFAAIVATVCAANPVIACSDEKAQQLSRAARQADHAAIDARKYGLEAQERATSDYMDAVRAMQDCATARDAGDFQ